LVYRGLSFLFCQNTASCLKYVGTYLKFFNIPKQGWTNFRNIWEPNQIFYVTQSCWGLQILGATVQDLVTSATRHPGFTSLFITLLSYGYSVIIAARQKAYDMRQPLCLLIQLQGSVCNGSFQSFSKHCVRNAVNYEKELLDSVAAVMVEYILQCIL